MTANMQSACLAISCLAGVALFFTTSNTHVVPSGCAAVALPRGAHKSLFRHASAERPTSYPYITGDTIRSFADHVFDETTDTADWAGRAVSVQHGDIVFLKTDYMAQFFEGAFLRIRHNFVLATHNSDSSAPATFWAYLDDPKLLAWYAMNPDIVHPKLVPMPIGFANAHWPHGSPAALQDAFDVARGPWQTSRHCVYVNVNVGTNQAMRSQVLNHGASLKGAYFRRERVNYSDYLVDVANSKYVLSPPGNGMDCHRTWEAALLGAIPIVESSLLDPLYKGLPVVVVQHWGEITDKLITAVAAQGVADHHCVPTVLKADYWLGRMLAHRTSPSVAHRARARSPSAGTLFHPVSMRTNESD